MATPESKVKSRCVDIIKKYKVSAYPTLVTLDGNGKELKRVLGYQSIREMVTFLKAE